MANGVMLAFNGVGAGLAATAALRRVLRIRDVWILACCHILFLGGYIGSIGYLPTYFVEKRGMTQAASGLVAGVAPLAFVVPLEMERVGPQLAGSAVGVALTAGYLGGVLAPIIGMGLVGINPVMGFAFWGGCYATSGCHFLLLKETGPRVRQAE